jgi:hypothetical protein
MVKIFFPALGVGFSELCKAILTFCHLTVNKIIEERLVRSSVFVVCIFRCMHPAIKTGLKLPGLKGGGIAPDQIFSEFPAGID